MLKDVFQIEKKKRLEREIKQKEREKKNIISVNSIIRGGV